MIQDEMSEPAPAGDSILPLMKKLGWDDSDIMVRRCRRIKLDGGTTYKLTLVVLTVTSIASEISCCGIAHYAHAQD